MSTETRVPVQKGQHENIEGLTCKIQASIHTQINPKYCTNFLPRAGNLSNAQTHNKLGTYRKFLFFSFERKSNASHWSQVSFLGTTIFPWKLTCTHQGEHCMISTLLPGNWGNTQEPRRLICSESSLTAGNHLVSSGQKKGG